MTPSDVKIVAENINDFIEVPDGINRLRKAVLTLAVSGKLVSQDKNEGDANDILFSENSKKKSQPIDQLPFNVPQTWQWVRLGDIGNTQTGSTPKQSGNRFAGGTIPFVRPDNIKSLSISETKDKLSVEDISNGGTLMQKKSLLMVCIGSIGKVGVAYQDVSFNQQINAIHPHDKVHIEYLLYCTASGYFQEFAWKLSSKTTLPILNKSKWESIPVPIPPYKEQERIVEKVKEVLKKLSELESQKNERDLVRSRLTRSAMQALGHADSKVAFEQLTELIKTSQDIKELENAILTLAVSGKIVPSKSKDLIVAQFSDKDLLSIVDGDRGTNYPSKSEFTNEGHCLFLNTSNVRKGKFNFSKCDFITKEKDELLRKGKLVREDIVLTTRGTIGNTAYFSSDIPFDNMRINSGMVILRCDVTKIFPPYLITFLNSSLFISQTNKLMSGSAQQQLPIRVLNQVIFPLPSLLEQKEIVKKVESLMELIARIKSTLDTK